MNTRQKDLINSLRQEGVSYSKIAFKLGMSENTVKAYCKRNNLGGFGKSLSDSKGLVCRNCGKQIEQLKGTKQRKFCSDACRVKWWNMHPELINRKAIYHIVCAHCGIGFDSYGNKGRKYCSHSCYIADRFSTISEMSIKP